MVFSVHWRYTLSPAGGREEPNLDDLGQAMSELGLVLEDLQNLWSETDSSSGAPQVNEQSYSFMTFSCLSLPKTYSVDILYSLQSRPLGSLSALGQS